MMADAMPKVSDCCVSWLHQVNTIAVDRTVNQAEHIRLAINRLPVGCRERYSTRRLLIGNTG